MAESLYLQLPRVDEPARWLLVDTLGNRVGFVQRGTLAEAAQQATGRRVTALFPGEHVTLLQVEVPSRNPQKVLQAVPYMLEDKLAEDVETLHFALGERGDMGQLVAVTARARVRACLDMLAEAGITPQRLVPDVCALAPQGASAIVAVDGETALVRLPDGSGFATDRDLAAQLLRRRAADSSGALAHTMVHGTEPELEAFSLALGDAPLEVVKRPEADGVLPFLSASVAAQRPLDLLQGEFKVQTPFQEHWRTWRVAAILAALCVLLGLTQQIVSYVQLHRQATALDKQVQELFSQAMPGSPLIPGSEQQEMQSKLAALQGGVSAGSLLALLDSLGTGLGKSQSVQVTAITYQNGSLQAQLQASDIGALDALKNTLNQGGVTASLDSVNATGGQVTGRIVLSGGSA